VAGCDVVKYNDEEKDFSEYLYPFVEQLVDSEGETYRDRMNTLLTAMGCGEKV